MCTHVNVQFKWSKSDLDLLSAGRYKHIHIHVMMYVYVYIVNRKTWCVYRYTHAYIAHRLIINTCASMYSAVFRKKCEGRGAK